MITFRQTTTSDIPTISEILAAVSLQFGGGENDLSDPVAGWVACSDDKPIAFALADRKAGRLLIIAVVPEATGKGLAGELMRQAEAWLFSHGWNEIKLTLPDKSHEHALGFFLHLGWTHSQEEGEGLRLKKANPRTLIKLEEHFIDDPNTGYNRIVRLQRAPSDKPHCLCLFLDGESYWRDMDVIPLLNELIEEAKLPPMTIALVGHVSGSARHEDYTCNESYAHFIGDAVMPWLKREVSGLNDYGHTICGLSLSGLMSVYLTLQYPQYFPGCISQSGSHWWKHEWFVAMARSQSPIDARFWLSVGDLETDVGVKHPPTGLLQKISQIEGVETATRVLEDIGGKVHFHKYHGGHSNECWRNELGHALLWIVNNEMQNR
ncbi:MAG: GNAT family N-acetyltransferase [Verrucomicrobiales bacterium]|nr:GNAT family N-acetyltransferase [Verrucomicrobiales bacterium]